MEIVPLRDIPIITPGMDIAKTVHDALVNNNIRLQDGDILVIAHKIVSRATNRIIRLSDVKPTWRAVKIARRMGEDPRKIQVILDESNKVIRSTPKHLITENKLGFVCANAGVDRSNSYYNESLALPPQDPDKVCEEVRNYLALKFQAKIGVIISDTHGRALRNGAVGVCLGVAGIPAVISYKGRKDIFGYKLKATNIAIADELASAAELVMGESDEGIPVTLIRGLKIPEGEGSHRDLIYTAEERMFY